MNYSYIDARTQINYIFIELILKKRNPIQTHTLTHTHIDGACTHSITLKA